MVGTLARRRASTRPEGPAPTIMIWMRSTRVFLEFEGGVQRNVRDSDLHAYCAEIDFG